MGDGTCDEGRAVKDIRLLSESALEKVVLTVKDATRTQQEHIVLSKMLRCDALYKSVRVNINQMPLFAIFCI
jgi:hypothetical protein